MKFIDLIKQNKELIAILFIASILRLYHLDFQSLWLDEIYTMNVASPYQTYSNLIFEVNSREGFPYLYFITLKILFSIFGHTAEVARCFSVVFGILSVIAIYKLGKELLSKESGLFASFLLAINEYNIYISQDARPYTFYTFTIILAFYFLSKLLKENTKKNAVYYGLSVGFLLNVNFFSFINILSHIIIILFYFLMTTKEKKINDIKNYLISVTIATIMVLPNFQMIIKIFSIKSFWVPKPTLESFSLIFKEFLGNSEMTLFIFTPIFIYFLVNLFNEKECQNKKDIINNKLLFSSILIFGWVFIFIIVLMVKSYGEASVVLTRYFTSILPVFFLVLGFGLFLIKNGLTKYILVIVIFTFSITNIFVVKDYYNTPNKSQFREASSFIINNNLTKQPVYTSLKYWFGLYLCNNKIKFNLIEEQNIQTLVDKMINDPSKINSFWYIDAHDREFKLSDSAQKFIDERFYLENNFDGFNAWGKYYRLLTETSNNVDFSKYKEIKIKNGDDFNHNFEFFENKNNIVIAKGWAFFENQDSNKTKIDVILIKQKTGFKMNTAKVTRPDITIYFKSKYNLDNAGFSTKYDLSLLSKGSYQIGLYLKNVQTKKEGLILTNNFINK